MMNFEQTTSFISSVERLITQRPRAIFLGLWELFPLESREQSRNQTLFSLIPPNLFQRIIQHLEEKGDDAAPLIPSHIYKLITDRQLRGLDISELKPASVAHFFVTGLSDQDENRRRFALLKAEEVFRAYFKSRVGFGCSVTMQLYSMITDEQFERCPLSEFTIKQFINLFIFNEVNLERRVIQRVSPKEIVGFFQRFKFSVNHETINGFTSLLSANQKNDLTPYLIARALARDRTCSMEPAEA